ncbi:MAG TPA: AMP-binding protein [Acidimicrobiia bacterium]|nr:AMP-binding protein [Acidimicrobiia bacterium]
MGTTAELTATAASRVAARAGPFHTAGLWSRDPVDLVADAAQAHASRAALVDRSRSLTYDELDAAVDGAAAALEHAGARPGDAVFLLAGNDAASAVAIHGALRLGALVMVAPVGAGAAQVRDIVAMASPVLAAAPAGVPGAGSGTEPGSGPGVTRWLDIGSIGTAEPERRVPRPRRDPDEPAMVIFTSGTTSRPKGVIHSLNTLLLATRNFVDATALAPDDNIFVISPLASVTGIMQAITVAPLVGAQVTIESHFDAAATLDLLVETDGTFFGGPDLLLGRVLAEAERRGIAAVPIRVVYIGGAMADRRTLERAEREFGITVLRAYGSSEAPLSTSSALGEPAHVRLADDGRPLAGVDVRIGSQHDPAECCIGGAHLFLGYVDPADDEHAFERDADGRDWFCTGDLAELHDGRLTITGRIKDVVIRNGMKIPISEVDGMVAALPAVVQCAGYGVTDPATGERLAIAVRCRPGAVLTYDDMVAGLVAAGAAKWKIPEELVLWDDPLPENAAGKIVRDRLEPGGAARPRTVAPRLRGG